MLWALWTSDALSPFSILLCRMVECTKSNEEINGCKIYFRHSERIFKEIGAKRNMAIKKHQMEKEPG